VETSPDVGVPELVLKDVPVPGENIERDDMRGPFCHDGVHPVWYALGVVPVPNNVGVYGKTGPGAPVELGMPDDTAPLSDAEFEGGVRSWPTLTGG
jgi:hypothetical protein